MRQRFGSLSLFGLAKALPFQDPLDVDVALCFFFFRRRAEEGYYYCFTAMTKPDMGSERLLSTVDIC